MSALNIFEKRLRDVIERQVKSDLEKEGAMLPAEEIDHLVDMNISRLADVLLTEYGRGT